MSDPTICVRLPQSMIDTIERLARRSGLSRAGIVRVAVFQLMTADYEGRADGGPDDE